MQGQRAVQFILRIIYIYASLLELLCNRCTSDMIRIWQYREQVEKECWNNAAFLPSNSHLSIVVYIKLVYPYYYVNNT